MAEREDVCQLVDNDELGPHFRDISGALQVRQDADGADGVTSLEYLNPALQVDENESHRNENESPFNNTQAGTNTGHPNVGNNVNEYSENGFQSEASGATTTSTSGCANGTCENTKCTCTPCSSSQTQGVTSPPVYYSNRTGETTVVREPVVVTQPDGSRVIQTQQCCQLAPHRYRRERPLRMRKIKLLQAFAILSIFVFFPLGIAAVYFAFKTEKEFNEGTTVRGNIDAARKYAQRTERLIIFSVIAALLVAVSVFAVIERHLMRDDEDYWRDANNNRVLPSG